MQGISPLEGWALNQIVELDHYSEGACVSFLRSSAERRQVITALLSVAPTTPDQSYSEKLGWLITSADHRTILQEAFNDVPIGMRGALARSGTQPHSRQYYRKLHDILKAGGRAAQVVRQLRTLDFERLRIVELLPSEICTPTLASRIAGRRMASDISALFNLLRLHGVEAQSLSESITRLSDTSDLADVWERWALKCPFPPHPVSPSREYVPITSGVALRRMALRYRNCARRYLSQVLEEQSAFAEFHADGRSVVIHLYRHRDDWVLDNMYGPDNSRVPPALREAALSYLRSHGVWERYVDSQTSRPWTVLRRLTRSSSLMDVELG